MSVKRWLTRKNPKFLLGIKPDIQGFPAPMLYNWIAETLWWGGPIQGSIVACILCTIMISRVESIICVNDKVVNFSLVMKQKRFFFVSSGVWGKECGQKEKSIFLLAIPTILSTTACRQDDVNPKQSPNFCNLRLFSYLGRRWRYAGLGKEKTLCHCYCIDALDCFVWGVLVTKPNMTPDQLLNSPFKQSCIPLWNWRRSWCCIKSHWEFYSLQPISWTL